LSIPGFRLRKWFGKGAESVKPGITKREQKVRNSSKPALKPALNPAEREGNLKTNSETGINLRRGKRSPLGPGPPFNNFNGKEGEHSAHHSLSFLREKEGSVRLVAPHSPRGCGRCTLWYTRGCGRCTLVYTWLYASLVYTRLYASLYTLVGVPGVYIASHIPCVYTTRPWCRHC